jgi:hypothetical protein
MQQTRQWLLRCGLLGALLFVLTFLIEGAVRGGGYSAMRHPISALSMGEWGWVQQLNFIVTGILFLAFAIGLRRTLQPRSLWGPLLIGIVAVGLIGAGIFTCDPLNGYPPGTPLLPIERSLGGRLHDAFSAPVFLCLPSACFVLARWFFRGRKSGWAWYSILSGLGMFGFFVLAALGFKQTPGFEDYAGLLQRLAIVLGWGWIFGISLRRV